MASAARSTAHTPEPSPVVTSYLAGRFPCSPSTQPQGQTHKVRVYLNGPPRLLWAMAKVLGNQLMDRDMHAVQRFYNRLVKCLLRCTRFPAGPIPSWACRYRLVEMALLWVNNVGTIPETVTLRTGTFKSQLRPPPPFTVHINLTFSLSVNATLLFQETQAGPEREKLHVTRLQELLEESPTL